MVREEQHNRLQQQRKCKQDKNTRHRCCSFLSKVLEAFHHCSKHWRSNYWPSVDNGRSSLFSLCYKDVMPEFSVKNNLQSGKIKVIYNIISLKQGLDHCNSHPPDRIKLTITAFPAPYLPDYLNGNSLSMKAGSNSRSDQSRILRAPKPEENLSSR